MRNFIFLPIIVAIVVTSNIFSLQLSAATSGNSVCLASSGCASPCAYLSEGGSTNVIACSQVPQCAPMALTTCESTPLGNYAICGVYYHYTSDNCGPTTIDNSHYNYSYLCNP